MNHVMTGTWCWWMFVNEHERNLFWSNISTNNHHLQISHPYHKMNHPTVEVLIEHLKSLFESMDQRTRPWKLVRTSDCSKFTFESVICGNLTLRMSILNLDLFGCEILKNGTIRTFYSNRWCWILTPSHRMYLFEMNRNLCRAEKRLHEELKWKPHTTELNQTP